MGGDGSVDLTGFQLSGNVNALKIVCVLCKWLGSECVCCWLDNEVAAWKSTVTVPCELSNVQHKA